MDVRVDEAGHANHVAPVDLLNAIVGVIRADDPVATHGDIALGDLTSNNIQEAGVLNDQIGAVSRHGLIDTTSKKGRILVIGGGSGRHGGLL